MTPLGGVEYWKKFFWKHIPLEKANFQPEKIGPKTSGRVASLIFASGQLKLATKRSLFTRRLWAKNLINIYLLSFKLETWPSYRSPLCCSIRTTRRPNFDATRRSNWQIMIASIRSAGSGSVVWTDCRSRRFETNWKRMAYWIVVK